MHPFQVKRIIDHARHTSIGQAAALQLTALWQSQGGRISFAAALGASYLLYRITLPAASLFSNAPSQHPFLAASLAAAGSVAVVAAVAGYVRARAAVNPERVYGLAMLKLNSHPGVLEVMGAPLAGRRLPFSA